MLLIFGAPIARKLTGLLPVLLLASCAGDISDRGQAPGSGGGAGNGAGGNGGSGSSSPLIGARIRRLTNAEYDASVAALLQTAARPGQAFTGDTRQSGFTVNAGQRVDTLLGDQLETAAQALAAEAVANRLPQLAPCSSSSPGDACAREFIEAFATRAFRRPATAEEKTGLFTVFQAGADGAAFKDGIELVITAVLQSASFLYISELGGPPSGGKTQLDSHETASVLSYLLTGGPPDDDLRLAAAAGQLTTAQQREAQARRLIGGEGARLQARRLIKEWLGIDTLESTGKDNAVYPAFTTLRPLMLNETDAFIDEVAFKDDASLATLLTAGYTVAAQPLASFYGLGTAGAGRLPLDAVKRRGILNHASFLSVHAHLDESAPVKRGVIVRKKLLCQDLPLPQNLQVAVIPPKPDPTLTTRERFKAHSDNDACSSCHSLIDPVGFAFESFDGMGTFRSTENNKPVDTTGVLTGTEDADGPFADSLELVARLAQSNEVRRCFARHVFRFASAQNGEATENNFLGVWQSQTPERQSNILELLVEYAKSDMFVVRGEP
jgi:hypothetical protein